MGCHFLLQGIFPTQASNSHHLYCRQILYSLSHQASPALLLLLSHFSRVRLCATPETAAHQAPPSLGFSRQEHWSGAPFPSPVHESEKGKGSGSVVPDSSRPHGLPRSTNTGNEVSKTSTRKEIGFQIIRTSDVVQVIFRYQYLSFYKI